MGNLYEKRPTRRQLARKLHVLNVEFRSQNFRTLERVCEHRTLQNLQSAAPCSRGKKLGQFSVWSELGCLLFRHEKLC